MINLARTLPNEDILKRRIKLHFRRFEFKYLVSFDQKNLIASRLRSFMRLDPFADADSGYSVTSLYLDSPNLKFYRENEAGLGNRKKILLRFYNDKPQVTFREIKRKRQEVVYKDRILTNGQSDSPVEKEIRFLTKMFHLRPTVWVRYRRQPWINPQNNLRITFDSDIISANAKHSFNRNGLWFRPILPGYCIMEVKFDGKLPRKIFDILGKHFLIREALSKYRLAIEKTEMV